MPILNMIAQGGGGGSNVGEPTNLSAVVTSASSVDITWTDNNLQALPPSTFQKSVLVRKVGSAPTTPSDGTTVVTETVMNTYQSSAYSDTGLTQGTTYYYQVFSYSTDGGITYGTPVSAIPSGGWQPGVNTYIYYPLKSNGNDYSGNNRNLTTSNLTFSNEVAVLGDNVLAYYNIGDFPNGTQAFTMSFWIRLSSIASSYNLIGFIKNYNVSTQFYTDWDKTIQIENDGTIIFNIYDGDSRMISTSSGYLSTNTWYNIIGIYDGSKMSMYINNTKIGEDSATGTYSTNYLVLNGYNSRNAASARWTQGDLSDFILENKARTAQEVADYYNQTKANYGIS